MKDFLQRFRWEFLLLNRNNLLTISVVVTGLYIGLFQLLKLLGQIELVAMVLILNDPVVIGLLFVGITVIFERDKRTLDALRVTPMQLHHYLGAKIVALSLLGTACAYGMVLASIGTDIAHGHFLAAMFLLSVAFTELGIILVARVRQFITFALYVGGALVLASIPLVEWLGAFSLPLIEIFPVEHALRLMAWSMGYKIEVLPWASYPILIVCNVLLYLWAYRRFSKSHNL